MKSLRKNLQWLILGFLCLVLILVFSAFFIYQMNTMIYSTMLNSILELASHDMVSIENFLERNWLDLTGIHQRLIIYQCDSILSVQDRMNLERSSSNFQQLYLVAEDGTIYNSQYAVYPPDQMDIRSFLDTNEDHIVRHYDYLVSTGEQKEMLLYAITLDNFEIEGIRFTHMIGLTPINQIQSRMAIHSFFKNGVSRGYTSVVNLNGDYIVNIDRTVSVNQRKNIFSLLDEGKMDSPWTNEVIAEKMGADESFQFSYRDQTGVENFLYFTPINSAPWFLISSVEQSVFTDLSQRFIFSSISMVLITLILVSTLFVIIVRTRKRTLSAISDARAKSSFLSNMSHEIRTPLNGIIGLLHLIKSHLADGNQKQLSVWVQKADETSRYLLSLINDILDVSKLQSSKLTLNLAPFLLSPMLDSIETMQQEAAINHGVKLILEKDILVPCVIGDQMRIEQVLMNIVGNAVKFTPAGGTILLSAGQAMEPDGRVSTTITCTDTGIGMSQEYLKSIWDSFSQEHNAASNGTKGTGLGMFISKGIIDAMGGEISVSSELGKGSVFRQYRTIAWMQK